MDLRDAVALVTGASGDIGAACASALTERGARMIVTGRDSGRLSNLAADVGAKALVADLTPPGAVDELAAAATDVYGRVDAVVHCAGLGWRGETAALGPARLDELVDVNLRAPLQLSRALLPGMLARGRGHLSFMCSIAGWTGVAHEAVYSATKAAVIIYAQSLRAELARTGVEVSVVSPGAVRSAFFANRGVPYDRRFPRPLTPDRVARAVVRGIESGRAHQMVPRWLALAPAARGIMPPVFRALQGRFG